MSAEAGGFLGRWSRRKAGLPEAAPAPAPEVVAEPLAPVALTSVAAEVAAPAAEPVVVLPTMDDVAMLTRSSDYSRFVLPGVEPGVKNAAMKKLFSDPHFNVMDGLDTYIDDYGQPDPIPPAMLRMMNQSIALGLFDDEAGAEASAGAPADASPDGGAPDAMAQSAPIEPLSLPPAASATNTDDDPDLRLQQDDADRRAGAGPGPRA